MAILQLRSNNPEFSHVLVKNPASGMMIKEIRQGKCFAWYSDIQTYNLYFKDGDDEVSYKQHIDEEFEYQNVSRYNAPLFVINAISDFLYTASKKKDARDGIGFEHQAYVNLIEVKRVRYLEMFTEHFPEYKITYNEVAKNNYAVLIATKVGIFELINFVNLFAMFMALVNDSEDFAVQDEIVGKYMSCLNVIDAPYFIRYLFKIRFLRGINLFKKFKPLLEKTNRYKLDIHFGDTGLMRRDVVESLLTFKNPIVDIGCGEGFYLFKFTKKNRLPYYAIDIDEEIRTPLLKKIKNKGVDNATVFDSLKALAESNMLEPKVPVDALLIEVIEHMSVEEAKKLVKEVLSIEQVNSLIITTPNKNFNQFYFDNDETIRHSDHKFEFTEQEFISFITNTLVPGNYEVKYIYPGDSVNGIAPTQGVIITKKS